MKTSLARRWLGGLLFGVLLAILSPGVASGPIPSNGPFQSGTIAALNGSVGVAIQGQLNEVVLDVQGTFSATLTPHISTDGVNWQTASVTPLAGGAAVSSITTTGAWRVNMAATRYFELAGTSYSSGSAVINLTGGVAGSGDFAGSSTAPNPYSQFSVLDSKFGSASTNHAAKASAGTLAGFSVSSTDTNQQWFMVFNSATVPGNGTAPALCFPIGPSAGANPVYLTPGPQFFGANGIAFATGISWAISSTDTTLTLTADSAQFFDVTVIGS